MSNYTKWVWCLWDSEKSVTFDIFCQNVSYSRLIYYYPSWAFNLIKLTFLLSYLISVQKCQTCHTLFYQFYRVLIVEHHAKVQDICVDLYATMTFSQRVWNQLFTRFHKPELSRWHYFFFFFVIYVLFIYFYVIMVSHKYSLVCVCVRLYYVWYYNIITSVSYGF